MQHSPTDLTTEVDAKETSLDVGRILSPRFLTTDKLIKLQELPVSISASCSLSFTVTVTKDLFTQVVLPLFREAARIAADDLDDFDKQTLEKCPRFEQ